jgi:hypothetical protein
VLPFRDVNAIQDSESEWAKTRNVGTKTAVVCDVKPCSVVGRHQCYLHLSSKGVVLMVDASSRSLDMLARIDRNT